MVKKVIVAVSALALLFGAVHVASAFSVANWGYWTHGEIITVPMKVETSYVKKRQPGAYSTLMGGNCDQYTHPAGFWPWGPWSGSVCSMVVKVKPPKCITPAWSGPVALGAPPPVWPGACLIKNVEKFGVSSPGCNPCVLEGLKYQIVKKQVVK